MEWNYVTDILPTLDFETPGGRISNTKTVLLNNNAIIKANYFKVGSDNFGWNIPNMETEVIAWKDV